MKYFNLIYLFLILVLAIPVKSQDNADYFPYKQNNYWEYDWVEWGYPDTIVSLSVFDSVDNQGRKIAIFDSYFINPIELPLMLPDSGKYIIDSSLNVFTNTAEGLGCNQEFNLIYKLNGKQGDQWVICSGGEPISYIMARIREIRDDEILGVWTKVMRVDYYWAPDSADTTGLENWTDLLAKGFGLQARGGGEAIATVYLKGAVIDGVLYGDTTNIVVGLNESVQPNQPLNFELFQNYPNPFNPNTTIKFDLNAGGNISLVIYDMLGEEVNRLIDDMYYQQGKYEKVWNGKNYDGKSMSSGIYFYRLFFNDHIKTKSMILIK